ncbi:hypothetical protein [Halobellus rarus]|uniref:Rpa-associated protein n=1 Tax=Halobellus rarus TaxID=1126237 RepID=A0ABD6CN68_9EURY
MSDAPQGREVARRLFAAEFDDATLSYSEGDDERAPNYVVTPTGARVNRLFAVGALTEVEQVNEEIVRGRIADPTGVFVSYAGQYQPDAMGFLDRASPPCFVSLTGKARTYQPEDSDRIFTSVRPESINEVDADTRDRWVVAAAEATLERVATTAAALELDVRGDDLTAALESRGVDSALAQGVALAVDHYEPTEHYLEGVRSMAVQALELVAGERDAVEAPTASPNDPGSRELGPLPAVSASSAAPGDAAAAVSVSDGTSTGDAAAAPDSPSSGEAIDDASATDESAVDSTEGRSDDVATEAPPADSGGETPSPDVAGESDADSSSAVAGESESEAGDTASDVEDSAIDAGSTTSSGESASVESDSASDDVDGESLADGSRDSADAEAGGLGDFGAETGNDATEAATGIADDEMYELDEEERAEIEAEYGTEFETGNEVDDPGEADIDVPDVDELESELDDEAVGATADGDESGVESDSTDDAGTVPDDPETAVDDPGTASDAVDAGSDAIDAEPDTSAGEPAADVDLEDAAVSVMADLDDGDGADREAVVAAVVEEYGADPDDVAEAIQEALMSGKCYEPNEGTLKSI